MPKLTAEQLQKLERLTDKGYCVEVRPVKDGLTLIKVIRERVGAK